MIYIKTKLPINPEELHDGNTGSNSDSDKPF
jgi:hypothetical protein